MIQVIGWLEVFLIQEGRTVNANRRPVLYRARQQSLGNPINHQLELFRREPKNAVIFVQMITYFHLMTCPFSQGSTGRENRQNS